MKSNVKAVFENSKQVKKYQIKRLSNFKAILKNRISKIQFFSASASISNELEIKLILFNLWYKILCFSTSLPFVDFQLSKGLYPEKLQRVVFSTAL